MMSRFFFCKKYNCIWQASVATKPSNKFTEKHIVENGNLKQEINRPCQNHLLTEQTHSRNYWRHTCFADSDFYLGAILVFLFGSAHKGTQNSCRWSKRGLHQWCWFTRTLVYRFPQACELQWLSLVMSNPWFHYQK